MKLWPHGGKNKIPNQLTQGSYLLPGALLLREKTSHNTGNRLPSPSQHCTVTALMRLVTDITSRTATPGLHKATSVSPHPIRTRGPLRSRLQYDPPRLDVHYLPAPKTAQSIPALGVVMAQLLFVSLSMRRLRGRPLKATASAAAQRVMPPLICDNVSKRAYVRA